MNLRTVDYLEWLKDQEDWILFDLDCPGEFDKKFLERELQLIRELKDIVRKQEVDDEEG